MSEANDKTESQDDEEETIRLDQFMKFGQLVESGGQAKHIIKNGGVLVNGEVEIRRGRKLRQGDVVDFEGDEYAVEFGSAQGVEGSDEGGVDPDSDES